MTNLLATIVVMLVTNTSERFPMHSEPTPPPSFGNTTLAVMTYKMVPDINPDKKWVTTTIKEVTTATFEFNGELKSVSTEKLVSATDVEFHIERHEDWHPVATNLTHDSWFGQPSFTNFLTVPNQIITNLNE